MLESYPKIAVPKLGEVEVRPTGAFAKHITRAMSGLMVAMSMEPLDEVIADIADKNPGLEDAKVEELAVQRRSEQMMARGNATVARVMGDENLMYALAADAIHQELEWCEAELSPTVAAKIVKTAMDVGGVREYLGECLTLLYTASPSMEEQTTETTDEESSDD